MLQYAKGRLYDQQSLALDGISNGKEQVKGDGHDFATIQNEYSSIGNSSLQHENISLVDEKEFKEEM